MINPASFFKLTRLTGTTMSTFLVLIMKRKIMFVLVLCLLSAAVAYGCWTKAQKSGDEAAAKHFYETCRMLAEEGSNLGQYNLAVCYRNGIGVSQNFAQAVYWFEKSASQGNEKAAEILEELGE